MAQTDVITPEYIQSKISQGKPHVLVFLKKGKARGQDDKEADEIQLAHLAYLFQLIQDGQLAVNGPVMGHPEIVGISLYRSADKAEVLRIASEDPGVRSGRLVAEAFDWFGIDGFGFPS